MKVKKTVIITLTLITILNLTGCSSRSTEMKILEATKIEATTSKYEEFETIDFNLGERTIAKSSGINETPYYLRGVMSVPFGLKEKLKPVIIVHGCHDNDNIKRFDTGFTYLAEYLAQNGYLAMSIDINSAYDWKYGDNQEVKKIPIILDEHLKSLNESNEGNNLYGIDLKNKIDFDNTTFIGHSVGGEMIYKLAEDQSKKDLVKVKSLLAIEQAGNTTVDYNQKIDNVAILVGGLDGDVIDLCGLGAYEEMSNYNNQKILSATLLKNANHNFFNSEVERNDAEGLTKDLKEQISRKEQEEFLKLFALDFLNASYYDKVENTIYDTSLSSVNNLYNQDVITYLKTPQAKNIIDINKVDSFKTDNVNISLVTESQNINTDKAPGINSPASSIDELKFLELKWENNKGKVSTTPLINDFSKSKNISMDLLLDGSNDLNKANESQSISLELVDKSGKSQVVEISKDSNLISYPIGKLDYLDLGNNKIIKMWDERTPMLNIRIPLSLYKDLNLANVKKLNILFNKTNSGSLMLDNMYID